jgi:hypothetical protein
MTTTIEDFGWKGEEFPSHRRYFSGGIHDNFVTDVSDKDCRLVHHYIPNAIEIYPSRGNISRVSSYQDILGDGKYLEFSDEEVVNFLGQHKRKYSFYKNKEAYEKSKKSKEADGSQKNIPPKWFFELGLEGST